MSLALQAGISARHLGFLELGRARPSQTMVAKIAHALGLDARECDALRLAAGYAPLRPIVCEPSSSSEALILRGRTIGEEAFAASLAIQAQRTSSEATQIAATFLAKVGLASFAAGKIVLREDRTLEIIVEASNEAPVDYLSHFWASGHLDKCALVAHTCVADTAFFWDEVPRRSMRRVQRRIIDEARDFGIKTGFVLPIRRADGVVSSFCAWGDRLDSKDLAVRTAGRLVATALLDTLDRLNRPPGLVGARLSKLETDILSWLAAGRSIEWISNRTSTSSNAVINHLTLAMLSLGATDTTQAIARALAFGLIGG
jgi:DNA-binding CsgD family transcriptional regulator/transcriptional regulator with XRE-family HTH domain